MSKLNSMLFNLSGKVVIVTGGATGLGKQMAEGLAEVGANLVITARRKELCEQVANEIVSKYGNNCIALQCDITDEQQVSEMVSEVVNEFGKIDILVNNAGQGSGALAEDYPLEKWRQVVDVNLTGTFICCQKVGREMIRAKNGKIINISSFAGLSSIPAFHSIGYTAAKGGIIAITRDLAAKWARYNIYVNAIAPGFFQTEMSSPIIDYHGEKMLAAIPMRRFGGEEDLKGPVIFLASNASNYVTGQVLIVDGGQLIC